MQPKTALEAFRAKSNSIVLLKKELGEIVLKAFLVHAVTELVESFNIGKTMNDMQIAFVVEAIIEDYYFLKPEDLKFCFNEAKKGRYGTMYDRIDSAVIFEWIEKYLENRIQIAVEENSNNKKQSDITKTESAMFISKLKFLEGKKEPIDTRILPPKKRELTEEEVLMQELLKEFDELYKDKNIGVVSTGVRYVKIGGKLLNQNDFCVEKIKELRDFENEKL